jgi:GMP synthase-like glutamine amidotransferase
MRTNPTGAVPWPVIEGAVPLRIQVLQHVPFEGPAAIGDWAADHGYPVAATHLYRGDPLPALDAFDRLVVMGGPMGIYDERDHPWLASEKAFLRQTIDAGKSIVGVCLGAQLLADALGSRVYRNAHREIGWFPIELTAEARSEAVFGPLAPGLKVYHWHGDTFDLPPGAVHLAYSAGCAQQAFLYGGRVLGLQCHLETTPASLAGLVAHCADEISPGPYVQDAATMLAAEPSDYARIHSAMSGLLDRLPA